MGERKEKKGRGELGSRVLGGGGVYKGFAKRGPLEPGLVNSSFGEQGGGGGGGRGEVFEYAGEGSEIFDGVKGGDRRSRVGYKKRTIVGGGLEEQPGGDVSGGGSAPLARGAWIKHSRIHEEEQTED